jgi:hypothetical protein
VGNLREKIETLAREWEMNAKRDRQHGSPAFYAQGWIDALAAVAALPALLPPPRLPRRTTRRTRSEPMEPTMHLWFNGEDHSPGKTAVEAAAWMLQHTGCETEADEWRAVPDDEVMTDEAGTPDPEGQTAAQYATYLAEHPYNTPASSVAAILDPEAPPHGQEPGT